MVARMQLLLVRHALPHRSDHGRGADPELSDVGHEQAARLPAALSRFPLSRLVSSPQRRSVQTAEPVAASLDLPIDIDERLAEYDRDMSGYVPLEDLRTAHPRQWERMAAGHLPEGVDEDAFRARIAAGVDAVVASAAHDETVALFSHGGVINVLLHEILGISGIPRHAQGSAVQLVEQRERVALEPGNQLIRSFGRFGHCAVDRFSYP